MGDIVVLTCTRNSSDNIIYTLKALDEQTRRPDLIVVVDGSSDNTPMIINEYCTKSKLPVEILKQEGKGVGDARQLFYEYIKNKSFYIVVFLDTEIIPPKNWIEKHLQLHKLYENIDIVVGGNPGEFKIVNSPFEDKRYFVQGASSIKFNTLLKSGGWDRRLIRGEDWDFALKLCKIGAKCLISGEIPLCKSIHKQIFKLFVKKILNRPSSLFYLRKYGLWYFKNYPQHFIADFLSVVYILSLGLALFKLHFVWLPVLFHLVFNIGILRQRKFSKDIKLYLLLPMLYGISCLKNFVFFLKEKINFRTS